MDGLTVRLKKFVNWTHLGALLWRIVCPWIYWRDCEQVFLYYVVWKILAHSQNEFCLILSHREVTTDLGKSIPDQKLMVVEEGHLALPKSFLLACNLRLFVISLGHQLHHWRGIHSEGLGLLAITVSHINDWGFLSLNFYLDSRRWVLSVLERQIVREGRLEGSLHSKNRQFTFALFIWDGARSEGLGSIGLL